MQGMRHFLGAAPKLFEPKLCSIKPPRLPGFAKNRQSGFSAYHYYNETFKSKD